ncbi:MAG: PQQ-dependent sugar dehydrogenase [Planctomycetota bacterium]|nr:PQQ-dependent sugar dehydrogenase [Planctomycetota bacterium]
MSWSTRLARAGILAITLAFLATCGESGGSRSGKPPPPPPPPPPAGFDFLEAGFDGALLHTGLDVPVKMALAPDGRLFFNELRMGNVRVIDATGQLLPTPFATLAVLQGAEQGLLGIALDPGFSTNGYVYVVPCSPSPDRMRVVRYTDVGNFGTAETTIIDNLPVGVINNAGDIQFALDGTMFLSIGDYDIPALAQTDGEMAGRVHRFNTDGTIPIDNPDPTSSEWVRGLRNSFDLAVHPTTGYLFGSENGPTSDDEINVMIGGRNHEWPSLPPGFPGSQIGLRVIRWSPVIVPTGIAWHDGTSFGPEYADNLFVAGYDDNDVRRLVLIGWAPSDINIELPFAQFEDRGIDNKPLDIVVAPDGSLYVSTFTGIWRIWKI